MNYKCYLKAREQLTMKVNIIIELNTCSMHMYEEGPMLHYMCTSVDSTVNSE